MGYVVVPSKVQVASTSSAVYKGTSVCYVHVLPVTNGISPIRLGSLLDKPADRRWA